MPTEKEMLDALYALQHPDDCYEEEVAAAREMAKTALEYRIPQYPGRYKNKHGWFWQCVKCKTILNDMARPRYCSVCGQAVKWI